MATKKITLNELRSIVKQIIKEESEINKITNIEHAKPGRFLFRRSFIDTNPFRVIVTVNNYNGGGGRAELLYGIHTKNNRDSFKYANGGDYDADIIDIDTNFRKNLITSAKSVSEDLDNQIRDEIVKWIRNEIKMS